MCSGTSAIDFAKLDSINPCRCTSKDAAQLVLGAPLPDWRFETLDSTRPTCPAVPQGPQSEDQPLAQPAFAVLHVVSEPDMAFTVSNEARVDSGAGIASPQSEVLPRHYISPITFASVLVGLRVQRHLAHADCVGAGGPPDGLPPALHDRHLLPALHEAAPLQLLNRPASQPKSLDYDCSTKKFALCWWSIGYLCFD